MIGWNKQRLKDWLKRRRIKTWQIAVLLIICIICSAYFLRHNNLKMVELRNDVVAADEAGVGIDEAMTNLNYHVFHHMNTEIVRPIELVKSYQRQSEAVIKSAVQTPNRDLYAEAAQACVNRGGLFSDIRSQCVIDYISQNNAGFGGQTRIELPDKDRFVYSFASPLWTPDLAGFSILASIILGLWLILRLLEKVAVALIVRRRNRSGF